MYSKCIYFAIFLNTISLPYFYLIFNTIDMNMKLWLSPEQEKGSIDSHEHGI